MDEMLIIQHDNRVISVLFRGSAKAEHDPRSLLKIPFTQRVDHSKKRTRRLSFAVGASDLPPMLIFLLRSPHQAGSAFL